MPRPRKSTPPSRSPKNRQSGRMCYSCRRRDTPYWREGWRSDILLCNACGLRYSKYRRVCMRCMKVGVKANFDRVSCPKCKNAL